MKIMLPKYVKYPVATRLCKMMIAIHEGESFQLETEDDKLYIIADRKYCDEMMRLAIELNGHVKRENTGPKVSIEDERQRALEAFRKRRQCTARD